MIQRVKNTITITCNAVNFTTSSNIEVYVKCNGATKSYGANVLDANRIQVTIPKSDAMYWKADTDAEIQFALTDSTGAPVVSVVRTLNITELLKESGYGS